jgi:hypothetical protein
MKKFRFYIDTDRDRVPDYKDCRPFDPKLQHIKPNKLMKKDLSELPIFVKDSLDYSYPLFSKEAKTYAPRARAEFLSTVKKNPWLIRDIRKAAKNSHKYTYKPLNIHQQVAMNIREDLSKAKPKLFSDNIASLRPFAEKYQSSLLDYSYAQVSNANKEPKPKRLRVGDTVKFKHILHNYIPKAYLTDTSYGDNRQQIPAELIKHGGTRLNIYHYKSNGATIVAIVRNFIEGKNVYIVKYLDEYNKNVQLGFLEENLELFKKGEKLFNHNMIGDGKFPNKYWVTRTNDFLIRYGGEPIFYSELLTRPSIPPALDRSFKVKNETIDIAFDTFEEAIGMAMDLMEDEEQPPGNLVGNVVFFKNQDINGVTIEDRISGEVYSIFICLIDDDWVHEERKDTHFTEQKMKEAGYVFQ